MVKKTFFILFFILIVFSSFILSDNLKGHIISEFYYVAQSESSDFQGQNGFWFRRIYFGYNSSLGNGWSLRIRLEMDSPAFEKSLTIPYLKNAHIKKKLTKNSSLLIGLIETPSFNKVEKFWGLRFIEKTPADFFKFASSRDTGIGIEGKGKSGIIYTIMVGNYGSNKGEWNKGKAVYGRLGYEKKGFYTELNGHYANDGDDDILYISAFTGIKTSKVRGGINFIYRKDKNNEEELSNSGISGFLRFNISNATELFARFDSLTDLNFKDIGGYMPALASKYKTRYFIAGLNKKLSKGIFISPNIKYIFYSGDNAPDGNLMVSLTILANFKSKF